MTNKELIDRIIKHDDEQAYAELFNRIYSRLIKFSIYYVKNYQCAEDVVSEVFVNFLKKKNRSAPIENVEAFFYTAVRNQSLKYLRKHKNKSLFVSGASLEDYEVATSSRPDQELMDSELYDIIVESVSKLPVQRRVIFEMVKFDKLKYKEVAEILTISQKTVEKHISLALKNLRVVIQDYLESKDIKVKKINRSSFLFFFM